jgi:hypothetical protein
MKRFALIKSVCTPNEGTAHNRQQRKLDFISHKTSSFPSTCTSGAEETISKEALRNESQML